MFLVVGDGRIDDIPGCACHIADQRTLKAAKSVEYRGFADIRLADKGDLDGIGVGHGVLVCGFDLIEALFHDLNQMGDATVMGGADGQHLVDA